MPLITFLSTTQNCFTIGFSITFNGELNDTLSTFTNIPVNFLEILNNSGYFNPSLIVSTGKRIINDKKNIGSAHVIKGDELIKKTIQIPVTEEDELELFFIALNETLGNLLKFTHQKNIIYSFKERIIFLKQNLNNQEYVDVLINLKQIKDRLRNCEKIGYDLNYFKQATLRILKALKNKFKLK